jgi:hypothetical protein
MAAIEWGQSTITKLPGRKTGEKQKKIGAVDLTFLRGCLTGRASPALLPESPLMETLNVREGSVPFRIGGLGEQFGEQSGLFKHFSKK